MDRLAAAVPPDDASLTAAAPASVSAPGPLAAPLAGDRDWTWQEVTGQIPDGAGMIQFGLVLRGPGRAEMRGAGLTAGR